jgi:CheY-like chemotaxis protein
MATVLVVDDVATFRHVVRNALKGAGHDVLDAPDGAAALEVLGSRPVDLVLLDMAMPTMNGVEFLTRLRADPRWDGLPVLVVSAQSRSPGEPSAAARGAQGEMLKSRFSLRDLVRQVNGLLDGSKAARV